MKYMKAMVEVIDLGEEEILTSSVGCTTTAFQTEDNCNHGNHKTKYSGCEDNGHMNHGGQ